MEKLNLCTKNISGVYIITNLVNGKRYIGSSNDLYERSYSHIHHLQKQDHVNSHLQNAWNKYGKDKFVIGILEYCQESERFDRESFYINCLNPEYNIASVDSSEPINFEERNAKISQSVLESWKSGKLKERKEQSQCWIYPCYIYDVETWSLYKECESFKEANRELEMKDFTVRLDTIGTRLFKDKYVIYLDKLENSIDIKNRICEDVFYYNSTDVTTRKYLIAESETGELFYFRKIAHLVNKFGSSKSTLVKHLKTATRENPFIIPKTNIKVYYSYDYIKQEAV